MTTTTAAPRMWGHFELPAEAVLTERADVQEGATVISSHYGRCTVVKNDTRGTGEGRGTTYLTVRLLNGIERHEAYPGNSTIPVLPPEATEAVAKASNTTLVKALLSMTHRIHANDTARVAEPERSLQLRAQRDIVEAEVLRRMGGQ